MTDTRKEFGEFFNSKEMRDVSGATRQEWIDLVASGKAYQIWQACQQLNDKRIADLLAVIATKDEALKLSAAVFSGEISDKSGMIKSLELLRESIAIKPENVELVEVGDFAIHEDKVGTRYPSQRMAYGYDEFKIGEINKLYTIKHKE